MIVRGMFPVAKPNPHVTLPPWVGFQVEPSATLDLENAECRGFQGLIREVPADPTQPSTQDTSEAFVVHLTTVGDQVNPYPTGDVGAIRAILDARLAALNAQPRRTFTVALAGGGIGVAFEPLTFEPTPADVQQIMGIVLLRAKAEDTMGVYGSVVMTVNGAPV